MGRRAKRTVKRWFFVGTAFCIMAAWLCAPIQNGNIYQMEYRGAGQYIIRISEYQRGTVRRAAYFVPEETFKRCKVGQYFRLKDCGLTK